MFVSGLEATCPRVLQLERDCPNTYRAGSILINRRNALQAALASSASLAFAQRMNFYCT
jgi:hypothetical protein